MTTNHHTAIAVGADADAATFNDPLSDLDTQITAHNTEIVAARGSLGSIDGRLDVSLNNDGTIATGAVDTTQLAADAVDGTKIADDAIDSEHYAAGSIDNEHLAADCVNGAKIADDAIDSEHYAAGSIDNEHLAADCVNGAKIADDAIDSEHYAAGSIDNEHFSDGAITAQSKFALADAANANGELIRYDEYNVHKHTHYQCIYSQQKESAAADTAADSLQSFTRSENNSDSIVFVRVAYWKRSLEDGLRLCGTKANTSPDHACTITFACGGQSSTETISASSGATDFEKQLDISSLTDDDIYEITVAMHFAAADGGAETATLTNVSIWGTMAASIDPA